VQRGFISLIETGQNQPAIGIILRTGWLRRWASSRRRWWRRLKDPLTVPHRRLPGEGNPPPTTLTQPVALERALPRPQRLHFWSGVGIVPGGDKYLVGPLTREHRKHDCQLWIVSQKLKERSARFDIAALRSLPNLM